ncbi:MAG: AgmX/PglI C-terminal domain-containing protein [bacterium]
MIVTDIDGDGNPDVIGAGKPTFVVNHNADPVFTLKSCDQVIVTDVAADSKRDLLCLNGNELGVYAYDGQLIWKAKTNARFDWCKAGDINGDLKADIECKIKGSKKFTRYDGSNGEQLAAGTENAEVEETRMDLFAPLEPSQDGYTLERDLDGDGKPEKVLVGKEIMIEGKSFSTNAKKYKRLPLARLESVYANGFESDADAQKVVEGLNDKLSNCYTSQVRKNAFAGQGQVLIDLKIDKKGKASAADITFSGIPDKSVSKCAQGVLKSGKYPVPTGEQGTLNVRMFYTFRDQ